MSSPFTPGDRPPRTDLGWLRHRSLRGRAAAGGGAAASSAVADFLSGRTTRHRSRPPVDDVPAGSASLDLSEPPAPVPAQGGSTSLDLSHPAPGGSTSLDLSHPAPAGSTSLDLSQPAPVPAEPAAGSTSLDLSSPAAPPSSTARARTAPRPASEPARRPDPRIAAGARVILTPRTPTVVLTRIQSGIGTLVVEAVCSSAVGDIRLGALYELADGTTSIVQRTIGLDTAPPGSRRPVVHGTFGEYSRLTVDLRQSRSLRRMLVYAFSESGRELAWGGTLIATTFGRGRIEIPLEFGRHHGEIALLSVYNVDGEFVLRSEGEKVTGEVRAVAEMFGYDRIAWADDRTPVP